MSEKDIDIQGQEAQDIVDITQLINPFPGLRPFGIEESHLFFPDGVCCKENVDLVYEHIMCPAQDPLVGTQQARNRTVNINKQGSYSVLWLLL